MQALTKNDMKPSRAPCFFSKSSLSRSRSAMTLVMSTSLKVVSMAAVFCASFRRLAMVRRSRGRFCRGSAGGARLDMAEHAAHLNGGAFGDGKVDDGAGHRSVHLDGDLVGFQLAQGLIDRDGIAHLDQPLGNGRLGDRFAQ